MVKGFEIPVNGFLLFVFFFFRVVNVVNEIEQSFDRVRPLVMPGGCSRHEDSSSFVFRISPILHSLNEMGGLIEGNRSRGIEEFSQFHDGGFFRGSFPNKLDSMFLEVSFPGVPCGIPLVP